MFEGQAANDVVLRQELKKAPSLWQYPLQLVDHCRQSTLEMSHQGSLPMLL